MSFDLFLKRYFAGVLLLVVALTAYLQARGVSYLLSAALSPDTALVLPPSVAFRPPKAERPSALAIRERNPFDSVTGPLSGQQLELPGYKREEEEKVLDVSDPLSVGLCPGVKVQILTESTDPLWSFAAIQGPGESHPTLRRVGDMVGDKKVAFIGFNPASASPTVWFEGSDSLCQSSLFGAEPPPAAKPAEKPSEEPAAPARGSRAVDPEIASKIKKLSETEYEIDRSAVDRILESQAELMRSARIVPEQKDGKVVGIRLFGIRPETLLGTMGFQNGDRLETINGFDMGSPEKALEAYARLRTANNLNVKLNRRGKDMSVDYRIK